jgi:membrane protease YdiL (CAAX protease family)
MGEYMNDKSNYPRPLEAFIIIILSFIFVIIVTQILMLIFIPDAENIDKNSIGLKMLITVGEVGLIIIPFVYVRSRNLSYSQIFRWNSIPINIIFWSIIIGLSSSIISDELDRLISSIFPAPELLGEIAQALRINSPLDFILLFSGTVIIASFVEESIIRGFLQTSLEKHQDVTKAVIYASLAWTIIHGMIYWALQIFLIGIIFGIIAWRANSIFPSVIAHAISNGVALFYYNINQEKIDGIYLMGEHVSPLFLLLATAGMVFGIKGIYHFYEQNIFIKKNND